MVGRPQNLPRQHWTSEDKDAVPAGAPPSVIWGHFCSLDAIQMHKAETGIPTVQELRDSGTYEPTLKHLPSDSAQL